MTTQLEQDLADVFGSRAGDAVDTDTLAAAATARGRRLRARAVTVRGTVTVVAVAAVALVLVRLPSGGEPAAPSSSSPSSPWSDWTQHRPPGGWAVPSLPRADVPADPSKIGTDPSLLHFTVDEWSVNSSYTTWQSTAGIETIAFARDSVSYTVSLARTVEPLDLALAQENMDLSGHLPTPTDHGGGLHVFTTGKMQGFFYLRWQPAPGVLAQIFSDGGPLSAAEQIRSRVRLDTTLRCTAPVRLTALPAGARLVSCETTLAGSDLPGRLLSSILRVGENTVDQAAITVTHRHTSASPSAVTPLTVAGQQATVFTDDQWRPSVEFADFNGLRIHVAGTGSYKSPTVLSVAESVRVDADPLDLSTWPTRVVP